MMNEMDELKLRYETVLDGSEKDKVKLIEFKRDIKALNTKNEEIVLQIKELTIERDSLFENASAINEKLMEYESVNEKNEKIMTELKTKCDALTIEEQQSNDNQEMIETLDNKLNLINHQYQISTERNNSLNSKYNQSMEDQKQLKIKYEALENEHQIILDGANEKYNDLKSEYDKLRTAITNEQNESIKSLKKQFIEERNAYKIKYDESIKKYEIKIDALSKENKALSK